MKRSLTNRDKKDPTIFFATFLMLLNPLIKIKRPTGLCEARKQAGPLPILLPKTQILSN